MSEQSEFLRALGLDSDEGEESDEESAEQLPSASDNKTMKQVRDTIKRLDNQLKKAQKEAEELRSFKAEVVRERSKNTVQSAFEKVWEDNKEEAERNTKLFFRGIAEDAEVTEDAVAEYLRDFGPKRLSEGVAGAEAPVVPDQGGGFAPTSGGEPPVAGMISSEDMMKLMADGDYEAVTKAVKSGRFKKNVAPWPTTKV